MGVDDVLTLWLPGEPLSKARARGAVRGHYTPKTTRAAQDRLRVHARLALGTHGMRGLPVPTLQPLRVLMHFMRGHRARRDVDNMQKLVMDAMEGLIWENDSQVTEVHVTQQWVTYAPGTLMVVEYATNAVPDWVAPALARTNRP